MNRRETLQAMGGAGLLASAGSALAAERRQPWGVQLFTVLALLEKDFAGTLRQLAALGYREVETIGSFGRPPAELRALFEGCGLISPSQHIAPDDVYASFAAWTRREITTDQNRANYLAAFTQERTLSIVEDAIVKAHALGQRYVVWPILFKEQMASRPMLDGWLKLFNTAGDMCAQAGLVFAYHNHAREFAKLGNDLIYDLILANTNPRTVQLELDFYWITQAHGDPFAYLERNKGRYFGCHVKDMSATGDFATVGQGTLPLPRLLSAARAAGVKHFYVEYDRSDDPMGAITDSIAYLKRQG